MKIEIKLKGILAVYLTLLLIINLILLFFPLTNVFGYEFAAVNALIISFFSGFYTISFLKRFNNENLKSQLKILLKSFILLLLVPFLISIFYSLLHGFCSFYDGLLFYITLTFPSVIIGCGLASIVFTSVNKFRVVGFIILFLLVLAISFFEIYFNPQVYLYNPLLGFFPGTIYDEGLSVESTLLLYRCLNFLFFLLAGILSIYFIYRNKQKNFFLFLNSVLIVIAALFYFFISPATGFTTTFTSLEKIIIPRFESEHFILYADEKINDNTIKLISLNEEYYFNELRDFYKTVPRGKIRSYIFYSREQKQKLFGSGNADVSKPWLNCIFVSAERWENTLRHETAHCFTEAFGVGIFKLAADFNPALIEGMAEAGEGFYDENYIHTVAAIAFTNNYKTDLPGLFSSFSFFTNVSGLSYVYSGSFVKYLVDKYGIEKAKKYYGTNDFNDVYKISIESAVNDYEKYILKFKKDSSKAAADYYFGFKPLVKKVCPRFIADRLKEGWKYLDDEDFHSAKKYFNEILEKEDNYSAIVGLSFVYEKEDSVAKAIKFLESKLKLFSGTGYNFNLRLGLADLYAKNRDDKSAIQLYEMLINQNADVDYNLISKTKIKLMEDSLINDYLSGSDFNRYSILKEINSKGYLYFTIPAIIRLSRSLNEDYDLFLKNFDNQFVVNNYISSYAAFKLSQYMLEKSDYIRARKIAGLALRFKDDKNFTILLEEHYRKVTWFFNNAERISSSIVTLK